MLAASRNCTLLIAICTSCVTARVSAPARPDVSRADTIGALIAAVKFESRVHQTSRTLYRCISPDAGPDTSRLSGFSRQLAEASVDLKHCVPPDVDTVCTFLAFNTLAVKGLPPGRHGWRRDTVVVDIVALEVRPGRLGSSVHDELSMVLYGDTWEVIEWRRTATDPGDRGGGLTTAPPTPKKGQVGSKRAGKCGT